ncbi:MAG: bifunctional metallophosphatase/5'-nucleotidase [Candidatus Obscuribacterales bacterium]|nr:bifunctional metallophosphatase/5'-nucleotidase [Candidatus Obscuribacterales bacterium]
MLKSKYLVKLVSLSLAAAGLTLSCPSASLAVKEGGDKVKITLLQLNDCYQTSAVGRGAAQGGLARVSTLKKHLMISAPDAIFVLAGDTLSPSVASQLFKGRQMISAWNELGLDYATFGNHEFDFGPFELLQRMKDSKFSWVCANVTDKDSSHSFGEAKPYVIREIDGVKIGIIGLLTPDTTKQSRPGPRVEIESPIETAKKYLPQMKADGAKVIVGLTHLSIEQDKELAKAVPFDLILGGHEHFLINAYAGHAPILKMGSDAKFLGKIEISYSLKAKAIDNIAWEIIPVNSEWREDPKMLASFKSYDEELSRELDKPVGETGSDLNAVQLSNEKEETNLGDFVADAFREATGADIALINGGSLRSNQVYPAGQLKKRDVCAILPFENPIVKIEVSGKTVKEALEHGVSKAGQADGRFPQISGMSFAYDSTKPPGSRVSNIKIGKEALDLQKIYTLAGNDYVTSGGDGYSMLKGQNYIIKPEEGRSESVVLLEALSKGNIAPKVDGRIQRLNPLSAGEKEEIP